MTGPTLGTITARELSTLLNDGSPIVLLDVRELTEWDFARIPGAQLMSLATIPEAAAAVDRDSDVVVCCHHGARSETAGHALLSAGFRHVRNLIGGIDAWSRDVDPRVRRY